MKIKNTLKGRRLELSPEALELVRLRSNLSRRQDKFTNPVRLYALEVEESLLSALKSLKELLEYSKGVGLLSEDEVELLDYTRDRCSKMAGNIYHKRDRMERPEVYSDINHRYDKEKRKRKK